MPIMKADLHWQYRIIQKHNKCGNNKQMPLNLNLIYSYSFNLRKEEYICQLEKMIMLLIHSLIADPMLKN